MLINCHADGDTQVIENLVIEADNLVPNVLEIDSDNYMRFGRKSIAGRQDHKVFLGSRIVVFA